jgi:hypothetical protein
MMNGAMMRTIEHQPGRTIVHRDLVGTVVLVVAGIAAAASRSLAKTVMVPVAVALGTVGIVTFVWSYATAVTRSRSDEIAVSQLYVVAGEVAPPPVKRALRWALWIQVVVAITVMIFGFARTRPEEFNWAATAVVTPLFGLGMNGMWVARYGTFGPRILTPRPTRRSRSPQSRDSDPDMEQNSPHG